MEHNAKTKNTLILPVTVCSPVDVRRLIRELENIDDFLHESTVRKPGTSTKMPRTSRLLDEVIQVNSINVLLEDGRYRLKDYLVLVNTKAPVVHMSFSADPSPLSLKRLVTWLRNEVHPYALLDVGLQPGIGAGCMVRTTNKYFDLSLKQHLEKQRDLLTEKLRGADEELSSATEEEMSRVSEGGAA